MGYGMSDTICQISIYSIRGTVGHEKKKKKEVQRQMKY